VNDRDDAQESTHIRHEMRLTRTPNHPWCRTPELAVRSERPARVDSHPTRNALDANPRITPGVGHRGCSFPSNCGVPRAVSIHDDAFCRRSICGDRVGPFWDAGPCRCATGGAIRIDDFAPTWAPDGRHIAFVRERRRGLTVLSSSVYVVRPDGSGLRLVGRSNSAHPAWAPAGKRLAIVRNHVIEIHNADGALLRRVAGGSDPAWSPDGTRIAFTRDKLWTVDVKTGDQRRIPLETSGLVSTPFGSPAWSSDQKRLVLVFGGKHIGLVPARGGLVQGLGLGQSPKWSPDGSRLAISCLYGQEVAVISPAGGDQSCSLGAPEAETQPPQWTRDGSRIAFGAYLFTSCTVRVRQPTGPASDVLGIGRDPSWSPDGRRLVFARSAHGANLGGTESLLLYVMREDGTGVRRLRPRRS
jgi:Tol biopolymer transport system component